MNDATTEATFGSTFSVDTPGWTAGASVVWSITSVTPVTQGATASTCAIPTNYFTAVSTGRQGQLRAGTGTLDSFTCSSGITVALSVARTSVTDSPIGDVLTATCSVTVAVLQTTKFPTITTCAPITIAERAPLNTLYTGAVAATNPNIGTTLLYRIVSHTTTPPSKPLPFSIDCEGRLIVSQVVYYSIATSYSLVIDIDNIGLGDTKTSTCSSVVVTVTSNPVAPTLTTLTFSINDLTPVNTQFGDVGMVNNNNINGATTEVNTLTVVSVPTPDYFDFSSAGVITVKYPTGTTTPLLDALVKSSYVYTVNASDSKSFAVYTITINLLISPRPPVTFPQARSVPDTGVATSDLTQPLVASHPQGASFTFTLATTPVVPFAITSGGVLSVTGQFDFNTQNSYPVTFFVTDSNQKQVSSTVTITITETNKAPYFTASDAATAATVTSYAFSVQEKTQSGATVNFVYSKDKNLRETRVYSTTACAPFTAATCPFIVDAVTGKISIASVAGGQLVLDRLKRTYSPARTVVMTVRVQDSTSLSTTATVNVDRSQAIAPRFTATYFICVNCQPP
jgi:hypothetical protein